MLLDAQSGLFIWRLGKIFIRTENSQKSKRICITFAKRRSFVKWQAQIEEVGLWNIHLNLQIVANGTDTLKNYDFLPEYLLFELRYRNGKRNIFSFHYNTIILIMKRRSFTKLFQLRWIPPLLLRNVFWNLYYGSEWDKTRTKWYKVVDDFVIKVFSSLEIPFVPQTPSN